MRDALPTTTIRLPRWCGVLEVTCAYEIIPGSPGQRFGRNMHAPCEPYVIVHDVRAVREDDGIAHSLSRDEMADLKERILEEAAEAERAGLGDVIGTAVMFGVGIAAICVGSLASPAHASEVAIAGAAEAAGGFPWWLGAAAAVAAVLWLIYRLGLLIGAVIRLGDPGTDDDSGEGGHVTPPDGWGDGR